MLIRTYLELENCDKCLYSSLIPRTLHLPSLCGYNQLGPEGTRKLRG